MTVMTRPFRLLAIALAAGAAFGLAAPAHATFVTYSTVGTFSGGDTPGTNVFLSAANVEQITFNNITTNSVNAAPSSSASFGSFDTSAVTATGTPGPAVSSGLPWTSSSRPRRPAAR
jgi:hypothetical protein